jgi:pescadillo protein
VIRAFAGEVSWDGDGSGVNANDERITHQVMDRPTQGHRYFTCEYVQPQWVFDSANNRLTLPVGRYAPGETLPPHLSPFVDDEREGYVPEYRSELDKYTSAAQAKAQGMYSHESEEEASDSDEEALDAEEVYAKELEAESQGKAYPGEGDEANADSDGEDEDEDEDKEEEAPVTATNKSKRQREEDEHHELRVNMMSKKAKRLYGRMQHGIQVRSLIRVDQSPLVRSLLWARRVVSCRVVLILVLILVFLLCLQEKQSTVKNLTEKRKKLKKK